MERFSFSEFWGKTPFLLKIGFLVAITFLVIYFTNSFSIWNGGRTQEAEGIIAVRAAQLKAEIAAIEVQEAASKAKRDEIVNRSAVNTAVRTFSASTFDCSTTEAMHKNFASKGVIVLEKGQKLFFGSGCAKLKFNGELSFLEGRGYVVTFDPINDPSPEKFGYEKDGRMDSSQRVLEYLNSRVGQEIHVVINNGSFLKIGG